MPIYAYRCTSCGAEEEVLQKISEDPLTVCTACGKATFVKQVTAAGFQLKGSGWYVTDFRDGGKKKGADGATSVKTASGGTSSAGAEGKAAATGATGSGESAPAASASPAADSGSSAKSSGDSPAKPASKSSGTSSAD
jgi:putative FmdB family regulatory protein